MKPSSFQATIENQFDYICKRAIKDERKNYFDHQSSISKQEIISETGDYLVNQFSTIDIIKKAKELMITKGIPIMSLES